MRVIDLGHSYELESIDGDHRQVLTFVKRIGARYPGNTGEAHAGTVVQEVVRALLDRARYVNRQIPCVETEMSIHHLQAILTLYEMRAKRVKGKHLTQDNLVAVEFAQTCHICGHVSCPGDHA